MPHLTLAPIDNEEGEEEEEGDVHPPGLIHSIADPQGGLASADHAIAATEDAHAEGIATAPVTPLHDPDDESTWVYQDANGTYLPIPPDAETMCGCMWGEVKEPHPAYLKLMAKRRERELEKYVTQLALNRKRAREQGDTDGSWGA